MQTCQDGKEDLMWKAGSWNGSASVGRGRTDGRRRSRPSKEVEDDGRYYNRREQSLVDMRWAALGVPATTTVSKHKTMQDMEVRG